MIYQTPRNPQTNQTYRLARYHSIKNRWTGHLIQALLRQVHGGEQVVGLLLPSSTSPLVKGVDVPHHALHESDVLVERDECAQRKRG